MYQQIPRPEPLFGHIFGDSEGFLVTFTGTQARLRDPEAAHNELTEVKQRSWAYPEKEEDATEYLLYQAASMRDAYFSVHLFREPGNRLAANAVPTVGTLWLDEDGGHFPEVGPKPTAIVHSSARCRHLYWQLEELVSIEWAVAMNRRLATWAEGDVSAATAARVLRAPGTANYKRHPHIDLVSGEFTGAGPWPVEVMEQAIPPLPAELGHGAPRAEPYDGPELELAEFLDAVEVIGPLPDGLGTKLAIVCPWVLEHSGGDRTGTRVGRRAGGGLWFHCDHDHCTGRSWTEFRQAARLRAKKLALIQKGLYE